MDYVDKVKIENTSYKVQDSEAARSVDGTKSHVEEANQIHTTTGITQTADFIFRTTAGDASISSGSATLMAIYGNTVQTGHTDETLTATGTFADEETTVAITAATWRTQVSEDGTYVFSYDGDDWKLNDNTVTLSNYGLSVTGDIESGDTITVSYTKLVIGSLSTAKPTSFVSTGFNQYNATAGYAHVKGENQYRIDGTYTSLGFTTTVGGTTEAVTVEDDKFTPAEDGYIYVTGGNGDILIALVWSGIRNNDPYEAYSETTVTIPTADSSSTALPTASYGMPSVGDVKDEVSFIDKQYIKRIGHYSYSEANLATVEALGVDYVYDLNDIFYVLATPVVYTLASTVSGTYAANDFGTEEFTGTSEALEAVIYYGNNLVDKLRNLLDIQSLGEGLELNGSELSASGGGPTVVQTVGASTTDVMSQNAVTGMIWTNPSNRSIVNIGGSTVLDPGMNYGVAVGTATQLGSQSNTGVAIGPYSKVTGYDGGIAIGGGNLSGRGAQAEGQYSIAIGNRTRATKSNAVAIGATEVTASAYAAMAMGYHSSASGRGSIALGSYSSATQQGEMNIGSTDTYTGYNSSNYRLLTGLYDGQSAHDAATVAQGNTLSSSAPTTTTEGVLGQLYTDTTNMHTYQCTAINGSEYTWTQRW